LYVFGSSDSDEKREKQKIRGRSQPEAPESVVVENPLQVIWAVEGEIGRPGVFGATWIGLLREELSQFVELKIMNKS
jgi:hypothetical protein